MSTQAFTYEEMMDFKSKETGPITQKWFKHKEKEVYKYQLDIFGEMKDYEEVKQ